MNASVEDSSSSNVEARNICLKPRMLVIVFLGVTIMTLFGLLWVQRRKCDELCKSINQLGDFATSQEAILEYDLSAIDEILEGKFGEMPPEAARVP